MRIRTSRGSPNPGNPRLVPSSFETLKFQPSLTAFNLLLQASTFNPPTRVASSQPASLQIPQSASPEPPFAPKCEQSKVIHKVTPSAIKKISTPAARRNSREDLRVPECGRRDERGYSYMDYSVIAYPESDRIRCSTKASGRASLPRLAFAWSPGDGAVLDRDKGNEARMERRGLESRRPEGRERDRGNEKLFLCIMIEPPRVRERSGIPVTRGGKHARGGRVGAREANR